MALALYTFSFHCVLQMDRSDTSVSQESSRGTSTNVPRVSYAASDKSARIDLATRTPPPTVTTTAAVANTNGNNESLNGSTISSTNGSAVVSTNGSAQCLLQNDVHLHSIAPNRASATSLITLPPNCSPLLYQKPLRNGKHNTKNSQVSGFSAHK